VLGYADKTLMDRYMRERSRMAGRDTRMQQVLAVREGRMAEVAPDLFPDEGPYTQPVTANIIDVAARDLAEMIAPLPAINCWSPNMTSESAQKKADKRTKIANGLVIGSDLQHQMYNGADWYLTYGFLPGKVEIDPHDNQPVIRLINPIGCYPIYDRFSRVQAMYQRLHMDLDSIIDLYPEFHSFLKDRDLGGKVAGPLIEVVLYHDSQRDCAFLPTVEGVKLYDIPNPLGKCMIHVARRPGPSTKPRGQFDDVLFVQLAKARYALLAMEAAHKAVQAPIVLPPDVPNVPLGPDSIIRTNSPQGVNRIKLDLPKETFAQEEVLSSELREGARFPEVRTGNLDSSVVTGRGVAALMGGFDTQVRTAQSVMARFITDLTGMLLETEETLYSSEVRHISGIANGTPFEFDYTPSRDIAGNYAVDVQYGLLAGLDPNRWLVFGLQAMGAGLVSKDFMRRQMPADLDAGEEERKIDVEALRDSLQAGVLGMAQAIPAMAQQGQDPLPALELITAAIDARKKGTPIEDVVEKTMTPDEPEMSEEEMMMAQQQAMPPTGMGDMQMGEMATAQLLAGLNSSGEGQMQARVARETPI